MGKQVFVSERFYWTPYGDGWHVQRPALDRRLASCAADAGAHILCNARVVSTRGLHRSCWVLEIRSGEKLDTLRSKFIVYASGRLAGTAGVPAIVYDRLIGISWTGATEVRHSYMVIESTERGWFYANSMPNGRLTIVLMTDSDIYRNTAHDGVRFWREELRWARHTKEAFPESAGSCPQQIHSAASIIRLPAIGKDWLSVGDASMSFDPLCGQGISRAIDGASHACRAIRSYFRNGTLPSSYLCWIRRSFASYLSVHREYYAMEQRWSNFLFWQRR